MTAQQVSTTADQESSRGAYEMSCQKFYQHGESGDLQHDDHGHGQDGTADFPVNEGEQQNQHGEGADDGQGHLGKPGEPGNS